MSKNDIALSALAMDLKRVALGYYRGSDAMAERFLQEAIKRKDDIDKNMLKPYMKRIIDDIEVLPQKKDKKDAAEYALMYSTLIQNASL